LGVVVLAAGKGNRMESSLAKVLHPVAGAPMLTHVLRTAQKLAPVELAVVIGHQGDRVREAFAKQKGIRWVCQKEMRGTGDAVRSAAGVFKGFDGPLLILYGDIPGVRVETLQRLRMVHSSSSNAVTLLTAELEDPEGYGRIIQDPDGSVARIAEEKDATPDEREIKEINSGIGIWESRFLFASLELLRPSNRQKEFYLTDLVGIARNAGKDVGRLRVRYASEVLGVNSREDLADVSRIFYDDKATALLKSGVTLEDPATATVEPTVEVDRDTIIASQVTIRGRTRIGSRAQIGSCVHIADSEIGDSVRIGNQVTVHGARVGADSVIAANSVIGREK
jgi:bifunctional UDP-N-acetylglucosamine pyrophosphorylase/glucosamine-1-phosphate N-acetyltransferase